MEIKINLLERSQYEGLVGLTDQDWKEVVEIIVDDAKPTSIGLTPKGMSSQAISLMVIADNLGLQIRSMSPAQIGELVQSVRDYVDLKNQAEFDGLFDEEAMKEVLAQEI